MVHPIGARRRARRMALQALYQWHISHEDAGDIEAWFRERNDYQKADGDYFHELLHQVIARCPQLDELLAPLLDRPAAQLGTVELNLLRIGTYELTQRPDLPYRVIIDQAISLAKAFGGEQSHRYLNAILDRLASQVRAEEKDGSGGPPAVIPVKAPDAPPLEPSGGHAGHS